MVERSWREKCRCMLLSVSFMAG